MRVARDIRDINRLIGLEGETGKRLLNEDPLADD
jgi:hypothetical protein